MGSGMINPNREIAKTFEEKAVEEIQAESLADEDKEASDDWDEDFDDDDEESEDEEE